MTHVEALKYVLAELGGRAQLKEVYPRVIKMISFKKGSNIRATLRTALQRNPKFFRQSNGKPDGWWELVSYQEDIANRDNRIKELEAENMRLKAIKTEDEFVARFLDKVKHNLKRDEKTVEEIRKLMDALGRQDADKELDDWLQGKDQKTFPNDNVLINGDYVITKHVENKVDGVASGGTGISINEKKI